MSHSGLLCAVLHVMCASSIKQLMLSSIVLNGVDTMVESDVDATREIRIGGSFTTGVWI